MATTAPWLTIIGIGEDGRAGLSPAALAALDRADFVIGGARHLALAAPLSAQTQTWPSPFAEGYPMILARRGQPTCVLATGDPFHYGVGAELARLVPADEIVCFPQPSAFSLAAARLGWSLPDCDCVSLHGRALERIIPHLQPGARILALSWDGSTPGKLARLLKARGFGASTITVLEAMGGPRERIRHAAADDFDIADIDPLNTVAIEVAAASDARVVTLAPGLDDCLVRERRPAHQGGDPRADPRGPRAASRRAVVGHRRGRRLHRHRMVPAPSAQPLHRRSRSVPSAPSVRAATRCDLGATALDIAHRARAGGPCAICRRRMPSSSAAEPRKRACSRPPGRR